LAADSIAIEVLADRPNKRSKLSSSPPGLDAEAFALYFRLMKSVGSEEIIKGGEEEYLFHGVTWRLVGASLMFDHDGRVRIYHGEFIYRVFLHQVGPCPKNSNWTRILIRTDSRKRSNG